MNRFLAFFAAIGMGIAASAMGSTITVYPTNNGFESPDQGGGYEYGNVPGWTAFGGSGLAANTSGFNVSGATNGNGPSPYPASDKSTLGQAAFLQGGDGGVTNTGLGFVNNMPAIVPVSSSITQTISLPAGTTSATLNFSFEGRGYAYGNDNGIVIYVNGSPTPISGGGTLASPLLPPHGGSFSAGPSIALPVGSSVTITFAGDNVNGGDSTTFIDNVSVSAVTPEPGSLSVLGFGAVMLLARRRCA